MVSTHGDSNSELGRARRHSDGQGYPSGPGTVGSRHGRDIALFKQFLARSWDNGVRGCGTRSAVRRCSGGLCSLFRICM